MAGADLRGEVSGLPLFDAGSRGDPAVQRVHDRVLTAANVITLVRLLGLPVFVWLMVGPGAYGKAFAVLVLVGATDWVDGYVARRFDQVTRIGKLADPLIDRALIATATITLLAVGAIPWPVVALIVVRDVALLGSALLLFGRIPAIPVSRLGKFSTACLLIGVPGFLLGFMDWPGADLFAVLAWVFTIAGLIGYYLAGIRYGLAARRLKRGERDASGTSGRC